jgi:hypothetical protein
MPAKLLDPAYYTWVKESDPRNLVKGEKALGNVFVVVGIHCGEANLLSFSPFSELGDGFCP